jgi:hypothetical protein
MKSKSTYFVQIFNVIRIDIQSILFRTKSISSKYSVHFIGIDIQSILFRTKSISSKYSVHFIRIDIQSILFRTKSISFKYSVHFIIIQLLFFICWFVQLDWKIAQNNQICKNH